MSDHPYESPILIEAINKSATTLDKFLDQHNEIIEGIVSVSRELDRQVRTYQSTIDAFPDSLNRKEYEAKRDSYVHAFRLVTEILS